MSLFTLFDSQTTLFSSICQTLGLIILIYFIIFLLYQLFTFLSTFIPRDLTARYGENSWVLITGASDGIGKAFSEFFAEKGFNIVLIARNIPKLTKVSKELQQINSKIQTRIISADFTESTKPGFFEGITKQIEGLDISILVNNVGMVLGGLFENLPEDEIINALIVNTFPQVLLTRKLLPRMKERKNKSAIINLASIMSIRPFAYFTLYSATKGFNDYFSRALAEENPNIDIISLRPSFVSTGMTQKKTQDFTTITPSECVEELVKRLGRMKYTSGHWKHVLFTYTRMMSMPEWVLNMRAKEIAEILFGVFGINLQLMKAKAN